MAKKKTTKSEDVEEVEEVFEEADVELPMENKSQIEETDLEIGSIPGVGPKTSKIFAEGDLTMASQVMTTSLGDLEIMGLTRTAAKKIRVTISEIIPRFRNFAEELSLEDIEGIGPTTAKGLREKGLNIHLLETLPLRELEDRYGITKNTAEKYQEFIRTEIRKEVFTTGLQILKKHETTPFFTFGADSLDKLTTVEHLGMGGVKLGDTYEFFGQFRTGKSQICHQLCVTVQLPVELGGVGKKAIFLDTEGTFSPTRIKSIVLRLQEEKGWKKTPEEVLEDILYARAYNSDSQQSLVHQLMSRCNEQQGEFGVLVLDSVTAHFRAEYAGRGTLAERQQTINRHLSDLARIADTYSIAIAVTNQVQSNPGQFFGDPTKAVGGNVLGHWATHRFYLRKSKGEKRVIRVFDSPVLPENEGLFSITPKGVETAEE
ncbi:MAG: DNA repair and recombination protein RadA [Candidatus Kariarchaeaceae archaeon]